MLLTDWNMEDALRVRKEEGMQQGMQQVLDLVKKGISLPEIEKMLSSSLAHR